jgi:hypothetical protein
MAHYISFQPMRVLIDGHDSDGRLILAGDYLAAVIVLLEAEHHSPDTKAKWHLEAGFGKCDVPPGEAPLWASPEEARAWVQERL